MITLQRMWINQPSAAQVYHHLHTTNVLAHIESLEDGYLRVYFVDGKVISQQMEYRALSQGWFIRNLKGQEGKEIN